METGFKRGRLGAIPLILLCFLGLAPPAVGRAALTASRRNERFDSLRFRTTNQMIRTMGGSVL